jgi:hypothetical protein
MDKEIVEKAKKRVKEKKEFNKQLTSFLVWGAALVFINLFWARGYMWSFWVILFWGLAVVKKGVDVYGFPFGGKDWEEKEIQKEIERMKRLGDGSSTEELPDLKEEKKEKEKREKDVQERPSWDDKDLV